MPTRRERRAAAEPSPPTEPFFMRLIGAPVVRKMLGIPFGKMGQCASPAKSARHARYPVSPVAAINAWAHMAGYLHESVSVVDVGGRGLGLVAAKAGVAAGEALVSVPLAACVTHDLALATPAVAELLARLPPDELEPHVSMAVWLMHARVHQPCRGLVASVMATPRRRSGPRFLPARGRSWPGRAAPKPELPRGLLGLSAPASGLQRLAVCSNPNQTRGPPPSPSLFRPPP